MTSSSPVPPAGPPTTAAALLDLLAVEGVEHVFGVPGGALIALLAGLKTSPRIEYVICRQETGAAYIADGYSRVGGGLGVLAVTSGPGATNALTGALNADVSGTPMLVISGEVKEQFFGRGFLQEGADATLDVVEVFKSAIGYSEMITSPDNAGELLKSALRTAWSTPRRATHLSIPNDVAAEPPTGWVTPPSPAAYRAISQPVDATQVAEALRTITAQKRPLLLLGERTRRPLQDDALLSEFTAAVERLSLPVVTTGEAKGVFPETHELSLRNYGTAGCRWPLHYLDDPDRGHFDGLLVLGSGLGGLSTNNWAPALLPDGPFVQIDEDPDVPGRAWPITEGVIGETTAVLWALIAAAETITVDPAAAKDRRALLAAIKAGVSPWVDPEKRSSNADPIKPQALMALLGELLPPGTHVLVDAGNCVGWCLHELVVDPPTRIHSALTMGPMGFATAAVVGAQLAAGPGVPCVAVTGDGAFMMQCAEVATAAQHGLGAIWIVLADHDLTMVSQGMAAVTGDPSYDHYYSLGSTDFGTVAQGFGAEASTASSVPDVAAAIRRALDGAERGVPQVVVVAIDTDEMPPYDYPPPPPHT